MSLRYQEIMNINDLDTQMRMQAFDQVKRLNDHYGYLTKSELDLGFTFNGKRYPIYNQPRGIFKPKEMKYLLSIKTVFPRPGRRIQYDDQRQALQRFFESEDFVEYAFMGDDPDIKDNLWLKSAYENRIPVIYLLGVSPGRYQAIVPTYIDGWDRDALKVKIVFGEPGREQLPPIQDSISRRYVLRSVKQRIHQARFRYEVITAYSNRCAISGLRETRLLDAAHIIADGNEQLGQPIVQNGLPLSKIHHAAFDAHLIGIDPDYKVRVSEQLLVQKDGPMLEALKKLEGEKLLLPRRKSDYPDRDRVAERFERFCETSSG